MGVGTKRCPAKKGPSGWDHGSRQQVPGRQLWVWRGRAPPHKDGVLQSVTPPSTIIATPENGRASCREGVCQNVKLPVVAVSLKKNNRHPENLPNIKRLLTSMKTRT